jgi:hypothetical protein
VARATAQVAILNLAEERLVVRRSLRVAGDEVKVADRHGYMGGWLALGRHNRRKQMELWEEIKWVRRHWVRHHFGRIDEAGQEFMRIIGRWSSWGARGRGWRERVSRRAGTGRSSGAGVPGREQLRNLSL